MLAMDVSGSMCSTDVDPNRITVAQQAAIAFIEAQDGGPKIGLVAFAGVAGLQVPPTTDTDKLIEAIDNFSTARGTAIGSAILTSIDGIAAIDPTVAPTGVDAESAQRSGYAPDVIVVLTDGANTQGVEPADGGRGGGRPRRAGVHHRLRHHHADPDGLHRPAGRRLGRRRSGGGGRWRRSAAAGAARWSSTRTRCRRSPRPPAASTTGPRAPTSCRRRWATCPATSPWRPKHVDIASWFAGAGGLLVGPRSRSRCGGTGCARRVG